jgi:hypothetical protein
MRFSRTIVSSLAIAALITLPVQANNRQDHDGNQPVRHLLLISVDGLHGPRPHQLRRLSSKFHARTVEPARYHLYEQFHIAALGFFSGPRLARHRRFPGHHGPVVRRHLQS